MAFLATHDNDNDNNNNNTFWTIAASRFLLNCLGFIRLCDVVGASGPEGRFFRWIFCAVEKAQANHSDSGYETGKQNNPRHRGG
jgi:hypothetical protein